MSSSSDTGEALSTTMSTKPKTFMDLPREIYLMVCTYLTPKEYICMAAVSKDYYLAVQQPLYDHIEVDAWEKLPRLVRTLTSVPVVSHISAKYVSKMHNKDFDSKLTTDRQRQRWQKLSDAQLRERDIKTLNIILDTANTKRSFSGVDLARCVGAISRRSNGINIKLSLYGPWNSLLAQLSTFPLPDVRRLVVCLGKKDFQRESNKLDIWDVAFSGSSFPDLKEVELDTLYGSPDERPSTIKAAASSQPENYEDMYDAYRHVSTPLYGLKKMTKISIKHNDLLKTRVLDNLFSSNIIPTKLTTLEIANCPLLHQVSDNAGLAVLLQRSLPLLQYLKLHVNRNPPHGQGHYLTYRSELSEHPERHLCNVVRELGQKIKSLDLALPFACNRMFLPKTKQAPAALAERDWPTIPREPYDTLRDRLLAAGYRYRRLICWNEVCCRSHEWSDMLELVGNQGDMISWEILSYPDKSGSWHVSGCLPISYPASDVLKRELPQAER